MQCCYNFSFTKALLHYFGPWRSIIRKSVVEYKQYGIMLRSSICGVMVNHQCGLYIGWSRYTAVETVIWFGASNLRWEGRGMWQAMGRREIYRGFRLTKLEGKGVYVTTPRRRWDENTKIYLKQKGLKDVDWFHLAEVRDQWRAVVKYVMNFSVP